jgi:putative membrane protein
MEKPIPYSANMDKKAADSLPKSNATDHMANERTFLAWIRTSVGIMAFGFVVEKFALFIKQIGFFFSTQGHPSPTLPASHQTYSSIFGIFLVAVGALMGLFSFINYRKTEKQIEEKRYRSSPSLAAALTVLIVVMGIFLVVYLINT